MPAFLVRLIKNRDIVGIFAADDEEELADAVDECTDVDAYEFVELPPGGIMWTGPAIAVPLRRGNAEAEEEWETLPWSSSELSETWFDVLYGYNEEEWTPFDPDMPREPKPPPSPRPVGPGQVIRMRKRGD